MRLYQGTIEEFSKDAVENKLPDILSLNFLNYYGRKVSPSEFTSWNNSLVFLNNSLTEANLKDNYVIIEYELPFTSRRIDVLLFGKTKADNDSVVLIELKQWSNEGTSDSENDGNLYVKFQGRTVEVPHPSLQVEGYQFGLHDFMDYFQDENVHLASCVYCHNYSKSTHPQALYSQKFEKILNKYPVFSKEEMRELGNFIREKLSNGGGLEVFNRFINSPIRPSKKLLDHTGEMIHKQQIFTLIDEQIVAYNAIMKQVKTLSKSDNKSIVIIKGGPGTGKSVIALEVMGELMRTGKTVYHATGSSAFTNTLRKIVGSRAASLFKFFNSFALAKDKLGMVDVLICDEAHRIRKNSSSRYFRSDEPQITELFRVGKLLIFFIDENQIVRPDEVGSINLILDAAKAAGIPEDSIKTYELKTQFRCSGSDAYLQWLDNLLDITPSNLNHYDDKMLIKICKSPHELKDLIDSKNEEKTNSARIVAGFCWPWSKPNYDKSLVNDVVIGDFEMPWERKDMFWKWATDPEGMEQVGTVYTAQGFEFDYIGVLFSNDLVYRKEKGGWISQPEHSYDTMVKRNNVDLTKHLKHVYRVLLSRAHKGVFIYFMDKETRKYFEENIKND